MLVTTLLFVVVFAVPLLGFYFYIALKDKNKRKMMGLLVIMLLFILASVVAYFVNRGKGV
ncbi:hypothetical protein BDE36_0994 [Arcticibacter tournemirensis]|uniref:Uncharacterized protein n=1 Tax=Arcticibacter tournemirensis TaxID=699437 RepID=A0A4Q0M947_9SPHI|nr:hypothetical protein [Arcticibacter tournemirensis]KAA8486751.1 hypothetical protein F1649_00635 [Arcticibacter tournemirensis]RXF69473.1 hypothetical protein EKH83_12400 [Arcticibacter tournemirensis]TQM49293.1 hypothetical protein BDE36_0994 [Arcticibacter tournemirensis]